MRRVLLGVVVFAALACWGTVASADDAEIGSSGGTVRPLQSTDIRMASESVQCICYQRMAAYRVDFRFENSGPMRRVRLGFPFYGDGDTVNPVAGFHAWADGRPIPVSLQQGQDGDRTTDFYAHEVDFPTGATTVTVDYLVAPTSMSMGGNYFKAAEGTPFARDHGTLSSYEYTLHTGANWAGTIGTAVLRWDLSPDFVGGAVPQACAWMSRTRSDIVDREWEAFNRQANAIARLRRQTGPLTHQWVFRDFEPTQTADGASAYDIALYALVPHGWDRNDNPNEYAPPETKASSWLKLDGYEYRADNLVDGLPSTAWAENSPGPGIGQNVRFALHGDRPIRELRILPGYAKRPELFRKYNRPKRLRFDYADGTAQTVTLADDPSLQIFPATCDATSARMTILDVYRGTTRNETYISEVELGTAKSPTFLPFETLLRSAVSTPPATAASSSAASSSTPSGREDPPAWRSVIAVLLGAALVAGVAIGTGLLGRSAPPEDTPSDG